MGEWFRIPILQHAGVEQDNTVLRSLGQGRSGTGEEERHTVSPSSGSRDAMVQHLQSICRAI
jgi:hypothetical protein